MSANSAMRTTEAATAASVKARKANAAQKRLPPLTAEERLAIIAFFRTDDCPDIYEQRKSVREAVATLVTQ